MSVKYYNKGDETYIAKNFRSREFDCKCSRCDRTPIDEDLVKGLQIVREHFGLPVNINSGYRCINHNREVGSKDTSQHVKGKAADIYINGIAPKDIAQYAESTGLFGGIGLYSNFVHLDTREKKCYWTNYGIEKVVKTHGTDTLKKYENKVELLGRLYIDDVDINVGLYNSNSQEVCDRDDSACYFNDSKGKVIIADHNNQSFKNLKNVKIGTIAKVLNEEYKCVKAIEGHNTGTDITDNEYKSLYGQCDVLMYTCRENWQNIDIRMFEKVKKEQNENLGPMINYDELAKQIAEDVYKTLKERLGELFAG